MNKKLPDKPKNTLSDISFTNDNLASTTLPKKKSFINKLLTRRPSAANDAESISTTSTTSIYLPEIASGGEGSLFGKDEFPFLSQSNDKDLNKENMFQDSHSFHSIMKELPDISESNTTATASPIDSLVLETIPIISQTQPIATQHQSHTTETETSSVGKSVEFLSPNNALETSQPTDVELSTTKLSRKTSFKAYRDIYNGKRQNIPTPPTSFEADDESDSHFISAPSTPPKEEDEVLPSTPPRSNNSSPVTDERLPPLPVDTTEEADLEQVSLLVTGSVGASQLSPILPSSIQEEPILGIVENFDFSQVEENVVEEERHEEIKVVEKLQPEIPGEVYKISESNTTSDIPIEEMTTDNADSSDSTTEVLCEIPRELSVVKENDPIKMESLPKTPHEQSHSANELLGKPQSEIPAGITSPEVKEIVTTSLPRAPPQEQLSHPSSHEEEELKNIWTDISELSPDQEKTNYEHHINEKLTVTSPIQQTTSIPLSVNVAERKSSMAASLLGTPTSRKSSLFTPFVASENADKPCSRKSSLVSSASSRNGSVAESLVNTNVAPPMYSQLQDNTIQPINFNQQFIPVIPSPVLVASPYVQPQQFFPPQPVQFLPQQQQQFSQQQYQQPQPQYLPNGRIQMSSYTSSISSDTSSLYGSVRNVHSSREGSASNDFAMNSSRESILPAALYSSHASRSPLRSDSSIQDSTIRDSFFVPADALSDDNGSETASIISEMSSITSGANTTRTIEERIQKCSTRCRNVIKSPEHAYKSASYIIENVQYIDPSQQKMYCEIAVKTLKKLAASSHYEGMFALGNLYVHGIPGFASTHVVNHHKAYQLYSSCAKGNHYDAMYHTARCLELGLGTQVNFNRALHYYRKAATSGNHPGAMCRLALCLLNSQLGQTLAPREGLKWLRLAAKYANEKYPQALYELAMLHDKGLKNLVWQDHKYSVDLLVKAAEYKFADAQYKLGEGYEYGKFDLPIAPAKSVYYYSLSAAQGHLEAMFELGGWYLTGTSDASSDFVLPQSDSDAYRWVKRAADGKLPCAMFAIGYFCEKGIGCEIDLQEAMDWYQKAALAGDAKAISKLNEKGLSINMKNGKVTAKNVSTHYHETTTSEPHEIPEVHAGSKIMVEKGTNKLKKRKGKEANCIIQ